MMTKEAFASSGVSINITHIFTDMIKDADGKILIKKQK